MSRTSLLSSYVSLKVQYQSGKGPFLFFFILDQWSNLTPLIKNNNNKKPQQQQLDNR